jgi:hypothetical protein
MLWRWSIWDVGKGWGAVEAGREFWNWLGFEYLTLLLLKIHLLAYEGSSIFNSFGVLA